MDRQALVGSVLAASAACSYGITVVIGRELAKAHLPTADALGLRFGIAGILLVALLAGRRRPLLPAPGERVRVILFGAVGYAVESAFFYAGLARGTAAAVTLLFYSYPAVVTVADLVITRRRPARGLIRPDAKKRERLSTEQFGRQKRPCSGTGTGRATRRAISPT